VTDAARVDAIAAEIGEAGMFAFDLEFVSEARYIPELSLMQVAWGSTAEPTVELIDCVAVDPGPVLAMLESPDVDAIAHAAKQDLGLLAARFDVEARAFWDTQIAAAFLGIGEQIGYAKLVKALLDLDLDKGAQFTAWLERPLSERQLTYAANDVLHLPAVWAELRGRLEDIGRLGWVREESRELVRGAGRIPPAELAYRDVKGWKALRGRALGSLRALAAWRQGIALDRNKPLSWVLGDRPMIELCRNPPRNARGLKRVRGVGEGTVRRYGDAILEAIAEGARRPVDRARNDRVQLSSRGQVWAGMVASLVQSRCAEAGIAARFVGTRADAEALVAWFESEDRDEHPEPDISLLKSWRRELAGDAVLAWLRGEASIAVATEGPAPLRFIDEG
jgi:ribonuclease D